MIPSSRIFDQQTLTLMLEYDALVQRYRAFFALFDWTVVPMPVPGSARLGKPAHPRCAYIKAFLLKIGEGLTTCTRLRRFLVEHPLLVIELGFRLVGDITLPYGFDVERTVPSARWFREKQRTLPQPLLHALLHASVQALREEIPGLGEVVAFDVTHIYAWVRENNPRIYVKGTFDVTYIPKGDPDCRLGVKKSSNQDQSGAPKKEKKESLFGYGSGIATSTDPVYGDVILAEFTQPFNTGDITYFAPLYTQAVAMLGFFPTHITADAAFDAWYVHQTTVFRQGISAVPLNQHSHTPFARLADGTPRCPIGLPMHPTKQYYHPYGYRAQRFQCPLLFPEYTSETCEHEQFKKGKGCVKDANGERGGIQRALLDRESPLYKSVYCQRTSTERGNSHSKALGLERPRVRNIHSVRTLNTLTYLLINAQALQRARTINATLLTSLLGKVA